MITEQFSITTYHKFFDFKIFRSSGSRVKKISVTFTFTSTNGPNTQFKSCFLDLEPLKRHWELLDSNAECPKIRVKVNKLVKQKYHYGNKKMFIYVNVVYKQNYNIY